MKDFDFMLTEDQISLRDMVREFAQKKVRPACKKAEIDGSVPDELLQEAFDMGLHLATLPEEYGGLGLSKLTYAIIREELANGDAGFSSRVFGTGFGVLKIAGTEKQKQMVAESMLNGGIVAFALTEADSGSNSGAMKTTAELVGDEYIINGSKTFITNAAEADFLILLAVTDKTKRSGGVTAFLVPKGTPGFNVVGHEDKMGFRCVRTSSIFFDDMHLPVEYRIGEEGQGFPIAMEFMDEVRPVCGSSAIGIAQAALDEAIAYAKLRQVGGKPIIKNQAITFLLADLEMEVQAARQIVWGACKSVDAGVPNKKLAAMSKCIAADTAVDVTVRALQVLGGNGYSREYPMEKLMRDARVFPIFEGTNEIQHIVISAEQLK